MTCGSRFTCSVAVSLAVLFRMQLSRARAAIGRHVTERRHAEEELAF